MYAVHVKFEVKVGSENTFKPLMLKQAENSLKLEPECRYFDVSQDDESPNVFYLYELYTSRSAFDEHVNSRHFLDFIHAVNDILLDKVILTGNRIN